MTKQVTISGAPEVLGEAMSILLSNGYDVTVKALDPSFEPLRRAGVYKPKKKEDWRAVVHKPSNIGGSRPPKVPGENISSLLLKYISANAPVDGKAVMAQMRTHGYTDNTVYGGIQALKRNGMIEKDDDENWVLRSEASNAA